MLEERFKLMQQKAAQLVPTESTGYQRGTVMLTPKSIKPLLQLPGFASRAEVARDIIKAGKKSMHTSTWVDAAGKKTNLHVYASSIEFPDICPLTAQKADHIEIVEVAIPQRTIRAEYYERDQDKVNRMHTALTCDRYWLAIPFSAGHGPQDKAISIDFKTLGDEISKTQFLFANRTYARAFAQLNQVEGGKWVSGGSHVMDKVSYWVIFFSACGLVGAMLPLIFMENKAPGSLPIIFGIMGVLLALLVAGILLRRKAKANQAAL